MALRPDRWLPVLLLAGCPMPAEDAQHYRCQDDGWCEPGWTCLNGYCRRACSGPADCAPGTECVGGHCVTAPHGASSAGTPSGASTSGVQPSSGASSAASSSATSRASSRSSGSTGSATSDAVASSAGASAAACSAPPSSAAAPSSTTAPASSTAAPSSSSAARSSSATPPSSATSRPASASAASSSSAPAPSSSGPPTCPSGGLPPAAGAPPPCNAADPDLLACYAFDADNLAPSGGVVRDGSSYGNDGTATGVSTVPDLDGMAAQFSGAAMISIPPAASLNPPTEFTLDAWVRPVTLPAAGARYGVFDRNGQFGMFLMDTGELRCSATNVVTGGSIPVNVWTHVACVISPTAVELYVNGLLAVTAARSGALNTGNQDVVAVGANSPSGDSFQGRLDRVRLWQTAHPANRVCTQ